MRAVRVDDESRVAEVRRLATALAADVGFNEEEAGRVAIVATELSTNLLKHAAGGQMVLGVVDDGVGVGVECLALDKGPGIADISLAMRDGHSTAGSAGTGLGAVSRLTHVCEIYAPAGGGAAILARVHRGDPSRSARLPHPPTGAICLPMGGEEACGDGYCVRRGADGLLIMVVDGLGHGPLAARASHMAVTTFQTADAEPTAATMGRLHEALRATRGAAASIARVPDEGPVVFIGVGNVAGIVCGASESRRMVSHNGTLGHALKSVRAFSYPAEDEAIVILASDGLGTGWALENYPGLRYRHPSLIAGVLYRDFTRGRDDVTVLVARRGAP